MVSRKAILVSKDPQIKAMVLRILGSMQWTIQDARDNAAALELVEAGRYDLIITSEQTSGGEDVELLCKIRRVRPHTRVIILADETTPADVVSAMREHAFGYFSTSRDALALIVQHAVEEPCWDDGIEISEMIDLPLAEKESVATAFRELLMNAIEHGGKFDPEKYVEISYVRTHRAVACRIKDPGEGFSLKEIPHAAIMNPPENPLRHLTYREAENLRPGGFGVLLVKNSIDELLYNEKGNEVVLVKYIDTVARAAG